MEGQPFFTTVAGLAVSLAGFGSVIAWLRDDPTGWDPINLWRVRTIVRHGLTLAFICLLLVPAFYLTGDETTTIRLGSSGLAFVMAMEIWLVRQPDPEVWVPRSSWAIFIWTNAVFGLLQVLNVLWGSLAGLQFGVLVILTSPAGIFYNFVREMGRGVGTASREGPD